MLVIGIIAALVGVGLWYAPVQTMSTGNQNVNRTTDVLEFSAPAAVLDSPIPYTVDWSASFSITVSLYDCGPHPLCTNLSKSNYVTGGTGKSGTLHWTGKVGEYYAFVSSTRPVEVDFEYAEPLFGGVAGIVFVGIGVVLVIAGIRLGPSRRERSSRPRKDPLESSEIDFS